MCAHAVARPTAALTRRRQPTWVRRARTVPRGSVGRCFQTGTAQQCRPHVAVGASSGGLRFWPWPRRRLRPLVPEWLPMAAPPCSTSRAFTHELCSWWYVISPASSVWMHKDQWGRLSELVQATDGPLELH